MPGPSSNRRPELVALGQALRERRLNRGWTLERLAQDAGISTATAFNIETGNYPNSGIGNVLDVAHALRCRLADVLADIEPEPEE
jgi:transcriptional regulator with XRE-family HTH domain